MCNWGESGGGSGSILSGHSTGNSSSNGSWWEFGAVQWRDVTQLGQNVSLQMSVHRLMHVERDKEWLMEGRVHERRAASRSAVANTLTAGKNKEWRNNSVPDGGALK